jgi:hypothetical protein
LPTASSSGALGGGGDDFQELSFDQRVPMMMVVVWRRICWTKILKGKKM